MRALRQNRQLFGQEEGCSLEMNQKDPAYWIASVAMETAGQSRFPAFLSTLPLLSSVLCKANCQRCFPLRSLATSQVGLHQRLLWRLNLIGEKMPWLKRVGRVPAHAGTMQGSLCSHNPCHIPKDTGDQDKSHMWTGIPTVTKTMPDGRCVLGGQAKIYSSLKDLWPLPSTTGK